MREFRHSQRRYIILKEVKQLTILDKVIRLSSGRNTLYRLKQVSVFLVCVRVCGEQQQIQRRVGQLSICKATKLQSGANTVGVPLRPL